jgi:hypothetical protein
MNKLRMGEVDKFIQRTFIYISIVPIALLVGYLLTGNKISLFASLEGLIVVLCCIFLIKDYDYKLFYITFFCIIAIEGAFLAYLSLFEPRYIKDPLSCVIIAFFIVFVIYFIYYYFKRGRYSKLPWE